MGAKSIKNEASGIPWGGQRGRGGGRREGNQKTLYFWRPLDRLWSLFGVTVAKMGGLFGPTRFRRGAKMEQFRTKSIQSMKSISKNVSRKNIKTYRFWLKHWAPLGKVGIWAVCWKTLNFLVFTNFSIDPKINTKMKRKRSQRRRACTAERLRIDLGKVYQALRGVRGIPLLGTSSRMSFEPRRPRNLLFPFHIFASFFDSILITFWQHKPPKVYPKTSQKWLPKSIPKRSENWHGK